MKKKKNKTLPDETLYMMKSNMMKSKK